MDKSSKDPLSPSLPDTQRHPPPPTPTPTPHHFYRRAHSSLTTSHIDSQRRSSIDTPLSLYASTRARLREELDTYISAPSPRRRHTVQVPLSALCEPQAVLGSIGGTFNSTTKVKSLPLPTIYNHHQFSRRGIRSVGIHSDRYLPISTTQRRWTVSDSLLNLSRLNYSRQKDHLVYCENGVTHSRKLKRDRETIPHRVEQPYYMNGHSAQLFNREEIPPNELELLQKIALSQNTHLYYGKGIQSSGGRATKTVERFKDRLQDSITAQNKEYTIGDIDAGRYSRAASRAVTPGSPIIEENEESAEPTPRKSESSRTFVTQQNN